MPPLLLYFLKKEPPIPIVQESGWTPESIRMLQKRKACSARNRILVIQRVGCHYTDRAILIPFQKIVFFSTFYGPWIFNLVMKNGKISSRI
jgi:hypothetical protein